LVAFVQTALGGMVGIYLLVRGRYFLESAGLAGEAAITAGIAVALVAALVALAKRDLGQVLAYSTLSQCGLLFAALGLGGYHGAVYHMWMHGFAKVLVFLVAGRAILAADGVTDLRQMGGLGRYLPYSYWVFLIGAASLAGVPPLGGFWSQMQIVLVLYEANRPWLWGSGCLVILLTAIYVFRLVGRIFWGSPHWVPVAGQGPERRLHASLLVLAVPLLVCMLGGLWPLWPGEGLEVLEGVSHVNVGGRLALLELGAIVSALTVVGAVLAWAVYSAPRPRPPQIRFFTQLARHGFYLEQGFKILVLRPLIGGGRFLRDIVDNVLIEGVGFGGGLLGGHGLGWILARLHNGRIDTHVLAMLVGLVSIVTYLFWDVEWF
jgi:NADH-quinone oxidoreductase subunit L